MDLTLRNATIIDGTGRARFGGDIGVRDGRIMAVGTVEGPAREEIDVCGAVVAPGFIDCHTHYDAQVCWDDMLSPSVYHGVTTAIAGNCGFTLAPLSGRSEDVDYLLAMLSNVEGMPVRSLQEAVKPDWRTFGEFLDRIDGRLAINTAFMVGHSALRRHVMGERAVGNTATADEIDAMAALLGQSLAAGGVGFSTTTSSSHNDHNGAPVPSRWASDDELLALARVAGEFPGTWVEMVLTAGMFGEREYELATAMSLAAGRALNWNAIFVAGSRKALVESQLAIGPYAAERGARVYGLTPAGAVGGMLNFRNSFALDMLEGWKPFLRLPFDKKIAAMRDPAVRERLRQGAENPANHSQVLATVDQFTIAGVENERLAHWSGRPLRDYAAERGLSAFDALFDLAAADDLWATFAPPPMGNDAESWAIRKAVFDAPYVLLGGSDAGAHLDLIDTFALTTQLLGESVRERGLLTLEEGVRRITSELADVFGLKGRGRIEVGACADLVVFAPDTIACGPIAMRGDLPGGECRLYGDAIGIHHVIVNGIPVACGNAPTGRKGGRVLRSGADTATVPLPV